MKTPSITLVHVLIGKSIFETLLVGALALYGFMSVVPPYFHGWGEVTQTTISGWVVNNAEPWERVEVELFIDGKFHSRTVANLSRPDVQAAGWSRDEWHGYAFPLTLPDVEPHEARVYAMHHGADGVRKSLQLVGEPIIFGADAQGRLTPSRKQ